MNARFRLPRRIGVLACAALPLLAHAEDPPAPRLELSVTQDMAATTEPQRSTQSMLWARARALSVGVGVEQRSRPVGEWHAAGLQAGPLLHTQSVLVGVSVAATPRTSIAFQAPLPGDTTRRDADAPRMALRSRDTLGELRAGLQLKMQLREQTTLSVRPRKGGLGVTLRSQW